MNQRLLEIVRNNRFAFMIGGVSLVTLVLTIISTTIYVSSGAINIDLSRPGYETVRDDTENEAPVNEFSPSGPIDKETVEDFNQRLSQIQSETAKMNNFSADALSDEALNLGKKSLDSGSKPE
ncbi:MAG: hypothetical protein LBL08_00485 [Candidatus Nomurabacteria bacterium]|jgi:hypothetical protein|nr:hypothetical protein [Candidatus Nomurabacteria bacterium]